MTRTPDESFVAMHRHDEDAQERRVDAGDGVQPALNDIEPKCPWCDARFGASHELSCPLGKCAYRCTLCTDTSHPCAYEPARQRRHDHEVPIMVDCCVYHLEHGGQLHDAALAHWQAERMEICSCEPQDGYPDPYCRVHGLEDVTNGAYDASAAVRKRIHREVARVYPRED